MKSKAASLARYTTHQIAGLLEVPRSRIYTYVRSGLVKPVRGRRNEYRFSFQDLILLKTAHQLFQSGISTSRIRQTLKNLRSYLPAGRPLTTVRIWADGDRVVARHDSELFHPESGQILFNFDVSELAAQLTPLDRENISQASREIEEADAWYDFGCEVEVSSPDEGIRAYREALRLDPKHYSAHLNLGLILHENGELEEAELHYRLALELYPEESLAAYNLGVVLQDQHRYPEAINAYLQAIRLDSSLKEAHFNLFHIYDRLGEKGSAIRHLAAYRRLS